MATMSLVTLGGSILLLFSGEGGVFQIYNHHTHMHCLSLNIRYNHHFLWEGCLISLLQTADRAPIAGVLPCSDRERGGQDGDVRGGRQHRAEHQDQQGFAFKFSFF